MPQPLIIVDSKLKVRMIDVLIEDLTEDLKLSKKFVDKNTRLIIDYALIKLQLQQYTFIIPYDELNKYNNLKKQAKKVLLEIIKLKNKL